MHNFVTGFPHSGTRVVQRLLYHAGVHVGDVTKLTQTYDEHYTLTDWNVNSIDGLDVNKLIEDFELFRQGADNWSLKNCEIMLPPNLELLDKICLDYTMILTMRHPVDNILIDLSWPEVYPHLTMDFSGDLWEKRMKFYVFLHQYFFDFFAGKDNVHIVVLENLINNPNEEIQKLFLFLNENLPDYDLTKLVEKPLSIGKRNRHYVRCGDIYCPYIYDFSTDVIAVKDLVANSYKEVDFSLWNVNINYSERTITEKELQFGEYLKEKLINDGENVEKESD